ncbi:MAG: RNA polymerase sigma-70 factor [Prolixibacteraceae bacterium]
MSNTIENTFHQFYSPLCNYATRIIRNEDEAEDIVQTLFIQLYEKNKLPSILNVEAYLLRSVRYKCIDYLRSKSTTLSIDHLREEPANSFPEISEDDIEPLFHYYAAKLPPKTREVFLLSRVNKLSYKEIAEELNLSQKTIENQMGSALKKLRKIVGDEHFCLLIF